MTPEKHYSYGIMLIGLLACVHQYVQKELNLQLPLLHAYLDDVLCMPIFLAIWRWEKQLLWKTVKLQSAEIVFLTCFIFVIFEGILPRFSVVYTSDWRDGLAYSCGSSIFYLLQKKSNFVQWTKKPLS